MGSFVAGVNESLGDGQRGKARKSKIEKFAKIIHYGKVEEISTDGNMRLKVRIPSDTPGTLIPWAEPFLPKMLNT